MAEEQQTQTQAPTTNGAVANGAATTNGAPPTSNWYDSLPQELKTDPGITRYKNMETFARSFKGLESRIGKSVQIPGDDATDEEKSAFYTKLGRPESADKYEFQNPDGWDEKQYPVDPTLKDWFKQACFQEGLSGAAANRLFGGYLNQAKGLLEKATASQQQQSQQGMSTLKQELGYDFDRHQALANYALKQFEGDHPEFVGLMREMSKSNPAAFKFLSNMGSLMGEDEAITSEMPPPTAEGVDHAMTRLDVLYAKDSAFWKGDPAAKQEVDKLVNVLDAAGMKYKTPTQRARES